MGTAHNFSPWFYGSGYDKVPNLLIILALLIPVIGLSNVIGIQYLITTRRENLLTRSVCIGAVANFVLNMIMIPFLYSYGAAIASVISELIITIVQFWYVRKELSVKTVFSLSTKYFAASIVMLIALIGLNYILKPCIISTLIMITAGGALYFILLFLLKDSMLDEIINTVKAKLHIN